MQTGGSVPTCYALRYGFSDMGYLEVGSGL